MDPVQKLPGGSIYFGWNSASSPKSTLRCITLVRIWAHLLWGKQMILGPAHVGAVEMGGQAASASSPGSFIRKRLLLCPNGAPLCGRQGWDAQRRSWSTPTTSVVVFNLVYSRALQVQRNEKLEKPESGKEMGVGVPLAPLRSFKKPC